MADSNLNLTNHEIILLLFDGGLQDECIWTFFSEIVFSKLSYYSLLQLLLGNRTTQIHIKRWYIIVLNCIWRYLFAFYMYGIICLLYIIYSSEFVFTLPLSFNQSENQTFRLPIVFCRLMLYVGESENAFIP